ncbi:MAG: hypothetical protein ACTSRP_26290 [Candidatus Helarchaeota archaeon]
MIYFNVITPLIMIILILIFNTIIAKIFLIIHKKVKRNRYEYFIFRDIDDKLNYTGLFLRAIVLGLLAFSLGMAFSRFVPETLVYPKNAPVPNDSYYFTTIWGNFLLPFLIFFLGPIWFLKDTGIICIRKERKKGRRELPDVEGVYNLFSSNINGYVGVGSIFSMIILMVDTITSISHIRLIDIFMVIFAPISLCLTVLIPIAFYEFWLNKNREKFIEKLSKKGYKIIDSLKNIEF